ncbi:MAG: branched-chain amino acid ABC transporter permease [Clostridia bacterium]|nr:branched-chain amino acid ABC transporter permease [Clostridia bacterium]
MKRNRKLAEKLITFVIVIAAFLLCKILIGTGVMSRSLRGQLIPICVYICMAVSLNLTVGISGELSLGHAGFMSVGAFSGIVAAMWLSKGVGVESQLLCLLFAILVGGALAGAAGVVIGIPVLRLRGDYLAIVTLAFGEIIRNVMNCIYVSLDGSALRFGFINPGLPGKILLNGPMGATGVKKMASFEIGFVLVLFTLFVVLNLIDSRDGRAIMAIRDSRIAAESVGLNVTKYKMMAFVTSAVLAGMAGALYGLNFSTVAPAMFKFDTSILVLVFVVLGGIGNIRGSVIAATLLTMLPELLRAFSDYRMLVYAIVLILVMIFTNNPTLKNAVGRLLPRRGASGKEAE